MRRTKKVSRVNDRRPTRTPVQPDRQTLGPLAVARREGAGRVCPGNGPRAVGVRVETEAAGSAGDVALRTTGARSGVPTAQATPPSARWVDGCGGAACHRGRTLRRPARLRDGPGEPAAEPPAAPPCTRPHAPRVLHDDRGARCHGTHSAAAPNDAGAAARHPRTGTPPAWVVGSGRAAQTYPLAARRAGSAGTMRVPAHLAGCVAGANRIALRSAVADDPVWRAFHIAPAAPVAFQRHTQSRPRRIPRAQGMAHVPPFDTKKGGSGACAVA